MLGISDSSKKESPCYHRLVSLQIDSRPSQVATHQETGKSDVALQNKSPPKSHIKGVLLGISDSFKKESPCYHRLVSLQIDSRPSQVVTHQESGKSDVALQNKSPPKSHIKVILLGISDSSKKESPCYHRLVSLQIDSRPSQVVTHQESGKSDVALQNKSPPKSHIKVILLGISDSSKKESPCYHRLVSLQIDSRPSQVVTHQESGKSDVALPNKSPPKSHIQAVLLGISDSSKKESPCYHRLVSLQIDSRPSQVATHQETGKSDVALQNKSPPKSHIKGVLLGVSDSFKKESPCYHRLVSLQIDSRPSQVVIHPILGKSDVALQNESPPKSHIKGVLLGISDSSKKESPCYHRLVSLQIDSRPSQVVTHQESGKSDVALQNKSPPKSHIQVVLLGISDSSKKESPCYHRLVSLQIDSRPSQVVTHPILGKSDVALQNKSPPKSHIKVILLGISDSSKKESPCYHRLVSLQIDSRPSQVVTHQESAKSDVALQNKSPPKSHIKVILLGISDSSKKESPCYHRLVSLQIDSRPSQVVTHQESGKSDVALPNKSPPKSHIQAVLLGISDSSKKESPCYHRLVSLQIDSRPSQVATHQETGKSDVALQNKSPPKSHIQAVLLGISDSSKKESPCYHRLVPLQIDSRPSQVVTHPILGKSDVALQNESPPKSHIKGVLLGISDSSKKESPCYHRLVSLQIDSRPSQVVTHQESGKSDVALQNKSPPKSHIQAVLLGMSETSLW